MTLQYVQHQCTNRRGNNLPQQLYYSFYAWYRSVCHCTNVALGKKIEQLSCINAMTSAQLLVWPRFSPQLLQTVLKTHQPLPESFQINVRSKVRIKIKLDTGVWIGRPTPSTKNPFWSLKDNLLTCCVAALKTINLWSRWSITFMFHWRASSLNWKQPLPAGLTATRYKKAFYLKRECFRGVDQKKWRQTMFCEETVSEENKKFYNKTETKC